MQKNNCLTPCHCGFTWKPEPAGTTPPHHCPWPKGILVLLLDGALSRGPALPSCPLALPGILLRGCLSLGSDTIWLCFCTAPSLPVPALLGQGHRLAKHKLPMTRPGMHAGGAIHQPGVTCS